MRVEELDTPAVIVDLDVMESNIRSLAAYAGEHGLELRPHTKTHKIPEIANLQLRAGSRGITVAKVGEAEVMAKAGISDILIHYPVLGRAKLERLANVAHSARVTVALDSEITARAISDAASRAGSTVRVLVEFDSGLHRCGVEPAAAEPLAQVVAQFPGIVFAGVTTYPGHIWSLPKDQAAPLSEVSSKVDDVLSSLRKAGIECETVSAGTTPTARNSHLVEGITEIRPGTYVFNDRNTLGVGACEVSQCALQVLVTVISTAVPGKTIVDGGSKTFSSDRWLSGDKTGFGSVAGHPEFRFEGMSEEHGHLDISSSDHRPKIGDKLIIIPNHVCACVNMHDQIWYHRAGVVEGSWTVAARGKVR